MSALRFLTAERFSSIDVIAIIVAISIWDSLGGFVGAVTGLAFLYVIGFVLAVLSDPS